MGVPNIQKDWDVFEILNFFVLRQFILKPLLFSLIIYYISYEIQS